MFKPKWYYLILFWKAGVLLYLTCRCATPGELKTESRNDKRALRPVHQLPTVDQRFAPRLRGGGATPATVALAGRAAAVDERGGTLRSDTS